MITIVINQFSQSPAHSGGQGSSITSKSTSHPHVAHIGVRSNDGATIKVVHIVVNRLTVNDSGMVKPENNKDFL